MKTVILGIGNILFQDEGVGIKVIDYYNQNYIPHPDIEVIDGGTLSFTLAGPLAKADGLILVDTAELESTPGTLKTFYNEAMDHFIFHGKKTSVHEVSVVDLLDIARLTDELPTQRMFIGIQPHTLAWGDDLTESVAPAVPQACDLIVNTLKQWGYEITRHPRSH